VKVSYFRDVQNFWTFIKTAKSCCKMLLADSENFKSLYLKTIQRTINLNISRILAFRLNLVCCQSRKKLKNCRDIEFYVNTITQKPNQTLGF
jgi:hypothetical protein